LAALVAGVAVLHGNHLAPGLGVGGDLDRPADRLAPAVVAARPGAARARGAAVKAVGPPDAPEDAGVGVRPEALIGHRHHAEVHHVQDRAVAVEAAVHRPLDAAVALLPCQTGAAHN